MSFGRKFWAGRKLKNLLTLVVSLTQTENRKLDLKTAKGAVNKSVFSIKNELKGIKARQAMATIRFLCVLVLESRPSHATLRTVNYTNFCDGSQWKAVQSFPKGENRLASDSRQSFQ